MFKKIVLHNFKSFSDLEFNLKGKKNKPMHMAMVFGENGAGKTNLMDSVRFLKRTTHTFNDRRVFDVLNQSRDLVNMELEGEADDSKEIGDAIHNLFDTIRKNLPGDSWTLSNVVEEYRMAGAEEMAVGFVFETDGNISEYEMKFDSDGRVVYERLRSVIGSRMGNYYTIALGKEGVVSDLSGSFVTDTKYRKELGELIERYWGNNTFLSIMNDQYSVKNKTFMDGAVIRGLDKIRKYLDSVIVDIPFDQTLPVWPHNIWDGWVDASRSWELDAYEKALDEFFTSICGDIRHVYYQRREKNGKIGYSLVFDKMIGGKIRSIPYVMESSGIKKLTRMFLALVGGVDGMTVFIDEIDSGIHDLMINELLSKISESISGQFVFTTHNTELLERADPRSVFVISVDAEGYRTIRSFSSIDKTQKNHNNRIRYLRGTFSGIPIVGYLDMQYIADMLPREGGGGR